MNTPSTTSKRNPWMRTVFELIALAGVLGLCVCMVFLLMANVFFVMPSAIEAASLRSRADQLDTRPTVNALTNHVTELLDSHTGSSQEEIHQLLDEIGGFTYQETFGMRERVNQEDVHWTLTELPMGIKVTANWSLRYDAEDRLIEVHPHES